MNDTLAIQERVEEITKLTQFRAQLVALRDGAGCWGGSDCEDVEGIFHRLAQKREEALQADDGSDAAYVYSRWSRIRSACVEAIEKEIKDVDERISEIWDTRNGGS